MTLIDVVKMAFHNLWSRKLRTTLNILGVVLSCVVLAMTFAGTKGVSEGFQQMIKNSQEVRRFAISGDWTPDIEVPEAVIRVEGDIAEERRERIQKRLKNKWLQENSSRRQIDKEELNKMRSMEHVVQVVPTSGMACSVTLDGMTVDMHGSGAPSDRRANMRVLTGEHLQPDDHKGVLLSEFAAYQLGYGDDEQLKQLVGKEIEISVRVGAARLASFLEFFTEDGQSTDLASQAKTLLALKGTLDSLDLSAMSEEQQEAIKKLFDRASEGPNEPTFVKEKLFVRGVVREQIAEDGRSFLDFVGVNSHYDIYLTPIRSADIQMEREDFEGFWAAMGVVDDVDNLKEVTEKIEEKGFRTNSAVWMVDIIDREITKAKKTIAILCLLILIISAIGISNTMVVSVLERMSEFGVLKALGARDQTILRLMLMEGALTGLLGAGVAIAISLVLASFIEGYVQQYVGNRIGDEFHESVFAFSTFDLSLVTMVALVVCTLAAIFPAYRAARLDPVVAMRRS